MDAAVAALIGAAIGVFGTVGSAWLAQRHQTKRELVKTASELALADFNGQVERARHSGGRIHIPPVSVYVWYHSRVLHAVANGTYTAEEVARIGEEYDSVVSAVRARTASRKTEAT